MTPRKPEVPVRGLMAIALLGIAGCAAPCRAPQEARRCDARPGEASTSLEDEAAVRRLLDAELEVPGAADRAWRTLGRLLESGRLRAALAPALAALATSGTAPRHRAEEVALVHDLIAAQLCVRGYLPRCAGLAYRSDAEVVASIRALLDASPLPRERRRLDDPAFVAELEVVQAARFVGAEDVVPLLHGPEAFAARLRLLDDARETLDVATWALYDDGTGHRALEGLVAAARRGVRVRVLLDGGRARERPFAAVAAGLRQVARDEPTLPLKVVLVENPARPFDGQHRKLIVADGRTALIGGRNFGDAYSHANPAETRRWRDAELLVTGPAVAQAVALFERRWTSAPGEGTLWASRPPSGEAAPASTTPADTRVAFVDHQPGGDDLILRSICKAFDGATRSIDIENAYVVRLPAVRDALAAAVGRGVRVRVLTNSAESLDEPILAYAVLRTAAELARVGVEVWLKRGDTLHSKFLLVDDVFAHVGSYNLHPRSHRLEGEVAAHVLDRRVVATLRAAFEAELSDARHVSSPDDVRVPDDPVGRLAWHLCPDLL